MVERSHGQHHPPNEFRQAKATAAKESRRWKRIMKFRNSSGAFETLRGMLYQYLQSYPITCYPITYRVVRLSSVLRAVESGGCRVYSLYSDGSGAGPYYTELGYDFRRGRQKVLKIGCVAFTKLQTKLILKEARIAKIVAKAKAKF